MSSEERFVKIENALSTLAEHHVQHAEEIRGLRAMQKDVVVTQRDVVLSQKGMVLATTKVAEAATPHRRGPAGYREKTPRADRHGRPDSSGPGPELIPGSFLRVLS